MTTAKTTRPAEGANQDSRAASPGGASLQPTPTLGHIPISLRVTNVSALISRNFLHVHPEAEVDSFRIGSDTDAINGQRLQITASLPDGETVSQAEGTLEIEFRYSLKTKHGGSHNKEEYLFKPPGGATLIHGAPNGEDRRKTEDLQTDRFDAPQASEGDVEVTIKPYYKGKYVGGDHQEGDAHFFIRA